MLLSEICIMSPSRRGINCDPSDFAVRVQDPRYFRSKLQVSKHSSRINLKIMNKRPLGCQFLQNRFHTRLLNINASH